MRILLLGEYSNVHWTLAEGLRALGHEVCVVSNGDYWKDYRRDVSLVRRSYGRWDSLVYMAQVWKALRRMRDYDVVQIINPMFLEMKSERIRPIYEYLRKHNKRMFMGAYGMDYYWVNTCRTTQTFRYSDFNFGDRLRTDDIAMTEVRDWIGTDKGRLNQEIAADCDGIAAGLYEYYACYHPAFPDKTEFIPFPINTDTTVRTAPPVTDKVRFFIGVQKSRGVYKGTDVMLRALERVADRHPDRCEIVKAESVKTPATRASSRSVPGWAGRLSAATSPPSASGSPPASTCPQSRKKASTTPPTGWGRWSWRPALSGRAARSLTSRWRRRSALWSTAGG